MPRVLSVGQCGYDHGQIERHLRRRFGAVVEAASTFPEAVEKLSETPFDLVLVNRINDADGSPGLDLIQTLKSDPALTTIPVMLVSNYEDAQQKAQALGALPGFGKSNLTSPESTEKLKSVLEPER